MLKAYPITPASRVNVINNPKTTREKNKIVWYEIKQKFDC